MERMLFAVFLWTFSGLVLSFEEFPKWGIQNDNKFRDVLSKITEQLLHTEQTKRTDFVGDVRAPNSGDLVMLMGKILEEKPMTLCGILWNTHDDDSLNECVAFLMKMRNEILVSREQKRQGSYKFNSSGWKRKKREASEEKLSKEEIMKLIQQILKVKKRRQFQATGW